MAYSREYWQDHVTEFEDRYTEKENEDGTITHIPVEGEIIQQGTAQNAPHFNNMEVGIADANFAAQVLTEGYLQLRRQVEHDSTEIFAEILGETHTVTLTNSKAFPFNSTVSSPVTVALTQNRRNLYYSVEATAVKVSGGLLGEIHITDKALNGFKVSFDGSAKSVTLELKIKGGMA